MKLKTVQTLGKRQTRLEGVAGWSKAEIPIPRGQADTLLLYRRYLQKIIKRCPWINETKLSGLLGSVAKSDLQKIKAKLKLVVELYPDGNIVDTSNLDASQKLSAAEIINCYKNVYLGLDSGFPKYFLQRDAEYRSKIIIRFLVNNILKNN